MTSATIIHCFTPLITRGVLIITMSLSLAVMTHGREWTSTDGSKTFEAELKKYSAKTGMVTVLTDKGKLLIFSQDKLSGIDISYLNEQPKEIAAVGSSGAINLTKLPDKVRAKQIQDLKWGIYT